MIPGKVKLVEVGPRDGLQNEGESLGVEERVDFINRLARCGLRHIEAGSFVRPDRVPQMAGTGEVLDRLDLEAETSYPVLVPNLKGLDGALAAGAREVAVFASATETFSQRNINCSIEESLERFRTVTQKACSSGVLVRGYISCVLGCPYEGRVHPRAVARVAAKLAEIGCYEISLGDTIGTGTPTATREMLHTVAQSVSPDRIAVHFHDTYGQALANILVALQCGVSVIDASVSGLGGCPYAKGASGNAATEDVIYMLDGMDIHHGVDLDLLIQTGRYICSRLKRPVMSRVNLALSSRT